MPITKPRELQVKEAEEGLLLLTKPLCLSNLSGEGGGGGAARSSRRGPQTALVQHLLGRRRQPDGRGADGRWRSMRLRMSSSLNRGGACARA